MIDFQDCKNGFAYVLHSRNLECGIFIVERRGFLGLREKFGEVYPFLEIHRQLPGTASPVFELEKAPDFDLTRYGSTKDEKATCDLKALEEYLASLPIRFREKFSF